jgi:hypothetical protein
MALGVYCECGRCLPIAEGDAGSVLTCSCGRRVVVPLLEEFCDHPVLLSAATVERRVRRLIAEGVLPSTEACLRCGDGVAEPVGIDLQCERYTTRASGGQRFLIIPLLWGLVWASWREPERLEIRGRDTDVPAPVGLCAVCQRQLRVPAASWYLLLTALLLVACGIVGYFNVGAGIGVAVVGMVLLVVTRRLALRSWQTGLRALLRKVPVYRQVLERYPRAVVVMPREGPDGE